MTSFADVAPEDVEELIVAWLTPLRAAAAFRLAGEELPFTLVRHVAGSENVDESTAELVVSVHTLCDKNLGEDAAAAQAKITHSRMLRLATHIDAIPLSGGRYAGIDYMTVVESPRWEFYAETVLRKVGRYAIGLTYT